MFKKKKKADRTYEILLNNASGRYRAGQPVDGFVRIVSPDDELKIKGDNWWKKFLMSGQRMLFID